MFISYINGQLYEMAKYAKAGELKERAIAQGYKESEIEEREITEEEYLKLFLQPTQKEILAQQIRDERNRRIERARWRIDRHKDQTSLAMMPQESYAVIEKVLQYIQDLRDVPQQAGFPDKVEWPVEPKEE